MILVFGIFPNKIPGCASRARFQIIPALKGEGSFSKTTPPVQVVFENDPPVQVGFVSRRFPGPVRSMWPTVGNPIARVPGIVGDQLGVTPRPARAAAVTAHRAGWSYVVRIRDGAGSSSPAARARRDGATVTGGRNDMPSFADDLSTDEIRAVVAYVRGMIESR